MMQTLRVALTYGMCLVWLGPASSALALDFTFTDILPPDPSDTSLGIQFVAINNHGHVAFSGFEQNPRRSLLFVNDGLQTSAVLSVMVQDPIGFPVGSISDNGRIGYLLRDFTQYESDSVRIWDAGTVTVVDPGARSATPPNLNEAGDVAYHKYATHFIESASINLASNGTRTTLAEVDYVNYLGLGGFQPALNAAGDVVSIAGLAGPNGISAAVVKWDSGGQSFPITSNDSAFVSFNGVDLNDNGAIALLGTLPSGDQRLELLQDGAVTATVAVAGGSQEFAHLAWPALTNGGAVLFTAWDQNNKGRLMVWKAGVLSTVIAAGEPLFGSELASLWSHEADLNERNQIVFGYQLADGRQGIARADVVPEPAALTLAAVIWIVPFSRRLRN